jgi:hypothetical protein
MCLSVLVAWNLLSTSVHEPKPLPSNHSLFFLFLHPNLIPSHWPSAPTPWELMARQRGERRRSRGRGGAGASRRRSCTTRSTVRFDQVLLRRRRWACLAAHRPVPCLQCLLRAGGPPRRRWPHMLNPCFPLWRAFLLLLCWFFIFYLHAPIKRA